MTEIQLQRETRAGFSQAFSSAKRVSYCLVARKVFMGRRALSSLLLALMLVCAPAAYPKGTPDKISIRGGKLARTVEITDRESLKGFDPWSGQFVDGQRGYVANPPDRNYALEVYFYMKWPNRHSRYDQGDLKLIYALRYYPGRNGEPGYIYLPARSSGMVMMAAGFTPAPPLKL